MGKKKKEYLPYHKQSLHEQIEDPETYGVRAEERRRKKKRLRADEEEPELVSAAISNRILKEARIQQAEIDAEDGDQHGEQAQIPKSMLAAALNQLEESDDDDDEERAYSDADSMYDIGEVEVTAEEERALSVFLAPGHDRFQQRSLSDMIKDKLRERQEQQGLAAVDEAENAVPEGLEEQVVEVYRGVGKLLSRFTVGKIPKAFKIIPNLKNWEEVLFLTEPEKWSPHAMFQATRIFVSNLNARLAQRFLALVLLPRIRTEIREQRKLHFALFQAMKKATYKPGAFYKGLLLPLASTRTCTLREAVIFTSCIKRSSLPVLHSAAALLRLAEMEYCGTTSFFIRVLLDKKYALPYKVVDALVQHFLRFQDDDRQLPVVWHQTLLCFVQRYKNEIRAADKETLKHLCQQQTHYQVTPEVVRELEHGVARDKRAEGPAAMQVQSSIGKHVAEDIRNLPPVPMIDED